ERRGDDRRERRAGAPDADHAHFHGGIARVLVRPSVGGVPVMFGKVGAEYEALRHLDPRAAPNAVSVREAADHTAQTIERVVDGTRSAVDRTRRFTRMVEGPRRERRGPADGAQEGARPAPGTQSGRRVRRPLLQLPRLDENPAQSVT